ncbi:hypothetical protein NDU88_001213 [Pleurodeles waltl]|uniref:Uncharacterized protein n=1 Tax=Pleurodeles waltl TaxID=8319 RepID=A0AAV7RAB8_PLEWA|nr:hypothetical protein NDU88_001213 [Pleurodeles waltl]
MFLYRVRSKFTAHGCCANMSLGECRLDADCPKCIDGEGVNLMHIDVNSKGVAIFIDLPGVVTHRGYIDTVRALTDVDNEDDWLAVILECR